MLDVYHCYALCGASALAAGALTRLQAHSLLGQDNRRILWLYRLGFAGLVPMLLLSVLDDAGRADAVPCLLALAVSAVACLAWALRELNGEALTWAPTALAVGGLGGVVVWASGLAPGGLVMAASAAFTLLGVLLLTDQLRLAVRRQGVTLAEQGLILVLVSYLGIFALAFWWTWTHRPAQYPAHGLFLPETALPVAASLIALMPLTVSSLVFAVVNERLVRRLENVALTDELTGALSRRGLRELGSMMIAAHERHGRPIAVLMVDIDFFKRVNDSHGHLVGDQALQHVSALLRQHLRPDALLCRYGGEEFTVLAPLDAADDMPRVAERLREVVASTPCQSGAGALKLTVSVGAAILSPPDVLERVLDLADTRLYQAKQTGRNRVVAA